MLIQPWPGETGLVVDTLGPWSPGWEVEDWAVGGHCAIGLLLQPRLAGWGAPCLVKQLPREAELEEPETALVQRHLHQPGATGLETWPFSILFFFFFAELA